MIAGIAFGLFAFLGYFSLGGGFIWSGAPSSEDRFGDAKTHTVAIETGSTRIGGESASKRDAAPSTFDDVLLAAKRSDPVIDAVSAQKALFSNKLTKLKALYREKNYVKAVPLAEDVLVEAEALYGNHSKEASGSAFNLGTLYNLVGQSDKAIPTLKRALDWEKANGSASNPSYMRVLKELLKGYRLQGPSDGPMRELKAALDEVRQEVPQDRKTATVLLEKLAWAMRRAARFEEAEKTFEMSRGIKTELYGASGAELVSVYNALAGVQRVRGRYGAAEASYLSAIAILRKADDAPSANLAIILDNLAVLYLTMGRVNDAEPVQKEALAIAEDKLGLEHPTVAQIMANLATLYENLNRYEQAESLFLRALNIWEGRIPPNDRRFGITYDNLAGTYREQGKLKLARETFQKALENISSNFPPNHPEVSTALNNMGLAELAVGNVAAGKAFVERSLAITERSLGRSHPAYAVALGNLGDALKAAEDFDGARRAYNEAVGIVEAALGPNHKRTIFPLRELGRLEYSQGNFDLAVGHFRKAAEVEIEIAKRSPGDVGLAHRGVFIWLMKALWQAAQKDQLPATEAVTEAIEVAQWMNLNAAGSAITKMGARLGTSDPELAALVRKRQDLSETWDTLDEEVLAAVSKPKAARDPQREKYLRIKLAALKARFTKIDERITKDFPGYAELVSPRPLTRDEIVRLAKARPNEIQFYFDVSTNWIDQFVVDPTQAKPVRWRRIRLSRKTLRDMVHTLRCGLDGGEWVGDVKPLKCLEATGQMPVDGRLPFKTDTAQELFTFLFGAFKEQIKQREVVIVADDALSALPFHVLLTAAAEDDDLKSAPWFGLQNPISVYPTVAALKTLRRAENASKATKTYFGVGNPLLTGHAGQDRSAWSRTACPVRVSSQSSQLGKRVALAKFDTAPAVRAAGQADGLADGALSFLERVRRLMPLPETADELCAVAETVGQGSSSVILGDRATEAEVYARSASGKLADYRVLHFATHGLMAGEIKGLVEPALVMTPPAGGDAATGFDGLLTASEVAGLRLDADWVVLSACNTAAGEADGGEALSGLARSFFYAGARSMLVSHWPVQSDAAVALTTVALAEMRRDPTVGRAEALRRAMVQLVASDGTDVSHPQVWAPFVVVGEGGTLQGVGSSGLDTRPARVVVGTGGAARGASAPSETGALANPTTTTLMGETRLVLPIRRPEVPQSLRGRTAIQSLPPAQSRARRAQRPSSQPAAAQQAPQSSWGEDFWSKNLN